MSKFVRNAWYMAAWESEINGRDLFTRTLLGEPRLVFRKSDGVGYFMLNDRCPHRFAPLSKGKRDGDRVACGYHGLTFDADGRCVKNPFSKTIPPRANVTAFPAVARHSIVWFWPGDPQEANPDLIPDFSFLNGPKPVSRRWMRMQANYEILTDNLMDLSHAEFVHAETFKTDGAILTGTHKVTEQADGGIRSDWWMANATASFNNQGLPEDSLVDKWLDMCWYAPASMWLEVGMTPAGKPRSAAPGKPMLNPHIVTPETDSSSHYFYTCDPGPESEAFADRVFETEDKPMLEAVQRAMADRDFWEMKPAILSVDAGALRARQRLQKMREDEEADGSAA